MQPLASDRSWPLWQDLHNGHTTAMHLLQSGDPIEGIAVWLGHESPTTTHQYTEANLSMKEKALARMQDPYTASRRFRATDSLLEFLKGLRL